MGRLCYPTRAPGSPESSGLASFAHRSDFSREGVKVVTLKALIELKVLTGQSERQYETSVSTKRAS